LALRGLGSFSFVQVIDPAGPACLPNRVHRASLNSDKRHNRGIRDPSGVPLIRCAHGTAESSSEDEPLVPVESTTLELTHDDRPVTSASPFLGATPCHLATGPAGRPRWQKRRAQWLSTICLPGFTGPQEMAVHARLLMSCGDGDEGTPFLTFSYHVSPPRGIVPPPMPGRIAHLLKWLGRDDSHRLNEQSP